MAENPGKFKELKIQELAHLEFLREQLTKLGYLNYGGIDFLEGRIAFPPNQYKQVFSEKEINDFSLELDEAIKDVREGMSLTLQGKSEKYFTDKINLIKNKLIEAGNLDPHKTL